MLDASRSDEVIALSEQLLAEEAYDNKDRAMCHYFMGNAYRQLNDWRNALKCYAEAIELDSESPATEAQKSLLEILDFYNHDLYNP